MMILAKATFNTERASQRTGRSLSWLQKLAFGLTMIVLTVCPNHASAGSICQTLDNINSGMVFATRVRQFNRIFVADVLRSLDGKAPSFLVMIGAREDMLGSYTGNIVRFKRPQEGVFRMRYWHPGVKQGERLVFMLHEGDDEVDACGTAPATPELIERIRHALAGEVDDKQPQKFECN